MNPKGGKIMNKKYENKRNGNIATLIAENEKCKTATLEYEDGKTTVVTTSTLKRWWKEVENELVPIPNTEDLDCGKKHCGNEEKEKAGEGTPYKRVIKRIILDEEQYVKEVMEQKKELGIEVPPIDPAKVEIVSITGSLSKKQKEAKKSSTHKKKEIPDYIKEAMDYVFALVTEKGDEIFVPANGMNMRSFKVGGHMYTKFDFNCTAITIAVKKECLPDNIKIPKLVNHMFNAVFRFDKALTQKDKEFIQTLLSNARAYRVTKNNKKTNKEEN